MHFLLDCHSQKFSSSHAFYLNKKKKLPSKIHTFGRAFEWLMSDSKILLKGLAFFSLISCPPIVEEGSAVVVTFVSNGGKFLWLVFCLGSPNDIVLSSFLMLCFTSDLSSNDSSTNFIGLKKY